MNNAEIQKLWMEPERIVAPILGLAGYGPTGQYESEIIGLMRLSAADFAGSILAANGMTAVCPEPDRIRLLAMGEWIYEPTGNAWARWLGVQKEMSNRPHANSPWSVHTESGGDGWEKRYDWAFPRSDEFFDLLKKLVRVEEVVYLQK